jgi:hypothetical protein
MRAKQDTKYQTEVVGWIGGGGRTRTCDLRIMRRPTDADSKQLQQLSPAKRGKLQQNPQTIRKHNSEGGAE